MNFRLAHGAMIAALLTIAACDDDTQEDVESDLESAVTEVVEPSPGDAWSARAPGRAAVPVYFVARCRRISGAVEP